MINEEITGYKIDLSPSKRRRVWIEEIVWQRRDLSFYVDRIEAGLEDLTNSNEERVRLIKESQDLFNLIDYLIQKNERTLRKIAGDDQLFIDTVLIFVQELKKVKENLTLKIKTALKLEGEEIIALLIENQSLKKKIAEIQSLVRQINQILES
ncbi:MAG TPA: hypothetical protein EYP30_02560 [Archaeoglobaceae archaeon]|nr:hypothetical protein [Archaeoglobaceae archaeon]